MHVYVYIYASMCMYIYIYTHPHSCNMQGGQAEGEADWSSLEGGRCLVERRDLPALFSSLKGAMCRPNYLLGSF